MAGRATRRRSVRGASARRSRRPATKTRRLDAVTAEIIRGAMETICYEVSAYASLAARCGYESSDEDSAETEASCVRTARFYTDHGVPDSECLDAFDCKTGRPNCERTSTNGDHFCATRETTCGSRCTGDIREGLNHLTFGMKPALIAALETCASQSSCHDVDACLAAWLNIFP